MLRVVVLASGSGTLFQALVDARGTIGVDIVKLIVDRVCPAVDRAHAAGIPVDIVELHGDRGAWDRSLLEHLQAAAPDVIVSAGFMKVIGSSVLARYEGLIINTHPALLPSYPGAHAVRDALADGARTTGCTVHVVDHGVDTGPVIDRREVAVRVGDDEGSLHERIRVVERELIVDVVRRIASGDIRLEEVV